MALTTAQLQALKAAIVADATLNAFPNNGDGAFAIAAILNVTATPSYWVLRREMGKHELTQEQAVDTDGTTVTAFVWGGATGGYIGRSQGERDAFKEIFNSSLNCNPSLPNVRTAFDDIFSGAGAGAVANRAHVKAKSRRLCTAFERIFVAATVGGPTQTGARGAATNPDTLGAEGPVAGDEVDLARNLP